MPCHAISAYLHILGWGLGGKAYIDLIVEYVQLYGGGANAPMIRFLDQFAKVYSGSVRLGS